MLKTKQEEKLKLVAMRITPQLSYEIGEIREIISMIHSNTIG